MSNILPTEADLCSRIILPYLQALGIGPDQIRLEKSFYFRFGRTVLEVPCNKSRTKMSGRLDILVRNADGENLFIIELKADGKSLTADDADQGIHYARNLDQIAPFVLISNGREAHIYDTITKKKLSNAEFPKESSFWANGRALATAEDLRIRYEAFRYFLGYSLDNVKAFSVAQQERTMRPLRGGAEDSTKKYIPEVYIPRNNLRKAVDRFIDGNAAVFALTGKSGVGKTNEMCALAEQLGEKHIALFFYGGAFYQNISEVLVNEFNWHFSDQLRSTSELMRRLNSMAIAAKCRIIILVDAIDEVTVKDFEKSMSDFASRLQEFDGNIKLIVSLKTSEWKRFESFSGNPSPLNLALDKSLHEDNLDEGSQEKDLPSSPPFQLSFFSENELKQVVPKYKDFFHLPEKPSKALRKHCRLPFILRVISEVYSGKTHHLPQDITKEKLLKVWLDKKFKNMRAPEKARVELYAVAHALYYYACNPPDRMMTLREAERISEAKVREMIKPSSSDLLCDELIAHGVLIRYEDEKRRGYFAFYYDQIRDYMLAVHVLELDQIEKKRFKEIVDTLLSNHLLQGALFWYLPYAPAHCPRILNETVQGRAALFINTYNKILNELVPSLKPRISPFTSKQIGVGYNFRGKMLYYCLYPVGKNTTKCLYELHKLDDDKEMFLEQRFLGAHSLKGGGENFSNTEPRYAAAQFALEQINEAVEKGMLDEMGSFILLKEAVLAIATKYKAELGLKLPHIKRYNTVKTPLDLQVLMKRLQTYFGEHYYLDQWTIEQIKKDKYVKMEFIGKINAHAISSDYHEVSKIKVRAETEAMAGKRFPPHGEKDLKILPELLDILIVKQEQIKNSVLPRVDIPPPYPDYNCPDWAFSDSQIQKVLECLFREGLIAYKKLVERNFSGILINFPFYQSFPITAVIAYDRSSIRDRRGGTVGYCFIPSHNSVTGAKVYLAPPKSIFRSKDMAVLIDGKYVKTESMHYTSFGHLFKAYEAPVLEATILAPIRAFAYNLIINEIKKIKAQDLLTALSNGKISD